MTFGNLGSCRPIQSTSVTSLLVYVEEFDSLSWVLLSFKGVLALKFDQNRKQVPYYAVVSTLLSNLCFTAFVETN